MKRKNLEKAIIMGLLTASISVPVWAENVAPVIMDGTEGHKGYSINSTYNEEVIITADPDDNAYSKDAIKIFGVDADLYINVNKEKINIISEKGHGIYVQNDELGHVNTVSINADNGISIQAYAPALRAENGAEIIFSAKDGDITITSTSQNDSAVIAGSTKAENGSSVIEINGKSNNISGAFGGIEAAGQSLDGEYEDNDLIGSKITVTATNGDNKITGEKFAVSAYTVEKGATEENSTVVEITAVNGNNILEAASGSAIKAGDFGTQVNVTAKDNILKGSNKGIYAIDGSKVQINADAQNKIIAGQYGSYASGNGTVVTLSAENNEIYVNNNSGEPGGVAKGIYVSDGATKEIVSKGNTTITSEGNVRDIIGIHADAGGTVDIDAGSLNIKATANDANVDSYLSGILAGDINQNVDTDNATVIADVDGDIHVDIYSAGTDSYGIITNKNGNVDLTSHEGNITINALDNVEAYTGATKYGIHTGLGGQTTLVAENGSISVNAGDSETYRGNNHGINNSGEMFIDAKENVSIGSYSYGDPSLNAYGSGIDVAYGKTTIKAGKNFVLDSISSTDFEGSKNYGAQLSDQSIIDIDAANVTIKSKGNISTAIYEYEASQLNIDAVRNNEINGIIGIQAEAGSGKAMAMFIDSSTAELNADNDIIIKATSAEANATGAYVNKSIVELNSENGSTFIISQGTNDVYGILVQTSTENNSEMTVTSAVNNYVKSSGTGIASWYDNSVVNLTAETGSNQVQANGIGIYNYGGAQANMTAGNGFNTVSSQTSAAIQNNGAGGSVSLQAQGNSLEGYNAIVSYGGNIDLNAATVNNKLTVDGYGIYAVTKADVDLTAENGMNYLKSGNFGIGIYADDSTVDLQAKANTLNIAADAAGYGSGHAIQASSKAQVNLNATAGDNVLAGVIYAKDEDTNVTLSHKNSTDTGSGSNYIYSSAHGSEDNIGDRSHVVAALYAQSKGKINVTAGEGGVNYIASDYTFEHEDDSEHTVWAQRGGIIEIKGSTIIESSNAEDYYAEGGYNTNSRGIAITAGSDAIITDEETNNMVTVADEDRSRVNLEYGADSAIYGDIVSGYGGWVNVKAENGGSLYMQGNALAGNGGILNLEIADGSTWYGRADDYGDAGYGEDAQNKQDFYNPAFSNAIIEGGQVNITMGEGSTWFLTGQSWVSSLDVSKGNGNVTIDMQEFNEGTHGLTIAEMTGKNDGTIDATFVMDLDHTSHSTSDMLYIKNGTGEYDVVLKNAIDGMENINEDNVLRFATVQGGAQFNSVTMDNVGLYNLGFEIDHSEYDTAATTENQGYNGASVDENKPGNENVEGFFDLDETAADEGPSNIMLLADQNQRADDSVQNWFITRVSGQEISDAGKTVVAMSKVNYSNAVYMDRLNKRLGEARYIDSDEDQGVWVRLRHDRTGKSGEFRSMNTMYEIGYDEKQECDNGERRVGAAIDYMDGSAEYSNVAGTGDIKRRGIWLYDTWMGDKGHYADYVAKWGHLDNDFKLYRDGQKITGDYSNNVYSISAEYGRKKDIGNDWYFEPQAQLQYARVTGASYTTSQGTEVDLDAINSLIARAGFRLGKDLSERSTVYFKADVLHEFLGDQDIYAKDKTGSMDVTYGNEGTWCDVGFGFAAAMSKTSYAYLDFEKSFGNDNDETYQINAGMQWSF